MIARISEQNPKMAKVRKRLKPLLFPIVRMRVLSLAWQITVGSSESPTQQQEERKKRPFLLSQTGV